MRSSSSPAYPSPPGALPREELVNLIARHPGPVFVDACAGSGKSVLAQQLGDADRPIIDEADTAQPASVPPEGIVLGRNPMGIGQPIPDPEALILDERRLWFSVDEVAALIDTRCDEHPTNRPTAESIHRATSGWPLAVDVVVDLIARDPSLRADSARIARRGPHFDEVMERLTATIPDHVLADVGSMASFSPLLGRFFTPPLSEIGHWRQARARGVPVRRAANGTLDIPQPARFHLTRHGCLTAERALRFGAPLVEELGLVTALRSVLDAGQEAAAADLLVSTHEEHQDAAEGAELVRVLDRLNDARPDDHRVNFCLARALVGVDRLDRAQTAAGESVRRAGENGAKVIELRGRILCHKIDLLSRRPRPGQSHPPPTELQDQFGTALTALELNETKTLTLSRSRDTAELIKAAVEGRETARDLAALGHPTKGAKILRWLATGPLLQLGMYNRMIDFDRTARELVDEAGLPYSSAVLSALASALAGDLRLHQSYLEQAWLEEDTSELAWTAVSIWLSRILTASYVGDEAAVRHGFQRYREHIDRLHDPETRLIFDALVACSFTLVGDRDQADEMVQSVERRADTDPRWAMLARLVLESRLGSTAKALSVADRLRSGELLPAEREWRIDLESLIARRRAGSDHDVPHRREEVTAILDRAAEVGLPKLARHLARPLLVGDGAHTVTAMAGGTTDAARPGGNEAGNGSATRVVIQVFGGFRVEVDGEDRTVPAGKPSDLVKLLALRGGSVHVEATIDALWPDVDPEAGRKRLKNVVNRARQALGDRLHRTGDMILLDPSVGIDVVEFRRNVSVATAARPGSEGFTEAAVAALNLYRTGLLPEDVYTDWSSDDRWTMESVSHRLLRQLSESTEEPPGGDWLIETANQLQVDDQGYYLRVARRAVLTDDMALAGRALDRAEELSRQLDLPFDPPADLVGVRAG